MNSGASEASGATHCTSRNLSMPSWVPVVMRDSAKGSAEATITAAANTNSPVTSSRLGRCDRPADPGGGPDEVRLGRLGPGGLPQVEDEEAEQGEAEDQADLAGQRDQERHDGGDEQEPELGPVPGLQHQFPDAAAGPPGRHPQGDDHHDRPAQAEQQPVGPGHVGRRVLHVVRVVPGGVREVEVHRVLGQHRDDGQDRDGQRAGDVDPGRFGRPGQQERRGHDGRPERRSPSAAGVCTPVRRRNRAGAVSTTHSPTGRASFGDMMTLRDGRAARTEGQGHPGQATLLAEGLAHPGLGPATGGPLGPQHVDDRLPDYSPSDAAHSSRHFVDCATDNIFVRQVTPWRNRPEQSRLRQC